MVYYVPRKFKCPQCGYNMEYSQSLDVRFQPVSEDNHPFCPKCLIKFIKEHVPEMELTT